MNELDKFCRGCLVSYNEPTDLLQYTEKNRRLFYYSTALQIKKKDIFTFQLCKDCYLNMKLACKFKKQCRTSDKQFKSYLALKEAGEDLDLSTYLKDDNCFPFRFPMMGNSTPVNKTKDDDNESTATSIRNFMSDMLQDEEIPDTEAQIIDEVMEEQADMCEDSLDSQWLEDDASIATDFRLDFNFSPFSTPRSVNGENLSLNKIDTPQKNYFVDYNTLDRNNHGIVLNTELPISYLEQDAKSDVSDKDSISRRIDLALENSNIQSMPLESLLASPKVVPGIHAPLTPTINNILFGEKLDLDEKSDSNQPKFGTEIETFHNVSGTMDFLEELFNKDSNIDTVDKAGSEVNEGLKNTNNTGASTLEQPNIIDVGKNKIALLEDVRYDLNTYKCHACDEDLGEFDKMKQHLKERHKIFIEFKVPKPKPKNICSICGHTFADFKTLRKHSRRHKIPKKFGCPQCKLQFLSRTTLQIHETTHANRYAIKGSYVCSICRLEVQSGLELYQHQASHKEKFNCDRCTQIFFLKTDLEKHMRLHDKKLQCPECPKKFIHRRNLVAHMKIHADTENLTACEVCGKEFNTSVNLKRHQSRSKHCRKIRNQPFAEQIQQTKDELAEFIQIG